jgi:outer membrane protein OmpA-like peptidoglycan-associated protein
MNYFYFLLLLLFSSTSNGQNSPTIEKKLFFEHNKYDLTEKATQSLDSLIIISNKFSAYKLAVVGYTDASI